MIFYKIKFLSFPEIAFAVTTRTDRYKNIITYRKDMLELGISDNNIVITENGKEYLASGKRISLIMPDMHCQMYAIDSEMSYLSSVALSGKFEFERFELESLSECKTIVKETKDAVLIPRLLDLDLEYHDIENTLRKICLLYAKDGSYNKMYALSMTLELIGRLDEIFRKNIIGETKESICVYYSKKTKKYIESHYKEKINVQEIADLLSISPNYLSNIFKQETGQTITEYIASVRLSKARNLLYQGKKSRDAIALEVGLSNARNMNRLFRKYYGMSTHKCLLADKEISLYHKKPWDVKQLKDDIYKKTEDEL